MRVLFAGGGTAGHIYPALAIANFLKDKEPSFCAHFVGTDEGLEASLIPHSGYSLETIRVHGFERKLSISTFKTMMELPSAVLNSRKIIKSFKPDIVIGTGGYVCGPVLYAAAKMGIPTLVHESNAYAGITTRILSRYVDTVAIGIEGARARLPKAKKVALTGNPVRPEMLSCDSFAARRSLSLDNRPVILIFGGSLGARDFNAAAANWICDVADKNKYQILMGTGKLNQYETVMNIFKARGINPELYPDIRISEYIYDMATAMNAADLVVSRAGASTLSELTALGKPSILVPSPYVTDNHQEHNARAVETAGGAIVITEENLTCDTLSQAIENITGTPERLAAMKKASRAIGVPDSTEQIYNEIKRLL